MNIKTGLLISGLSLFGLIIKGQQPCKLDKPAFQKKVIDQWWSFENKSDKKKDCDMRLLIVRPEGLEFNCINWADGFSGNKCKYELAFNNNFFEISLRDSASNKISSFLYGYLSDAGNLFLLIRQSQQPVSTAMLSEKDWIKFDRIER